MNRTWTTESRRHAERSVELHSRLRSFLIQEFAQESPTDISGALMYELVSLVAAVTTSEFDADRLITALLDRAGRQIETFGVGRPHP